MTCEFARDDGAYVLGALSPTERLAFKQHLSGCAECTRSVAELAGLPGLLGRVDRAVLEQPVIEDLPSTLLPALFREVRRTRRRRTLTAVGLAAAAAAVVVVPVGLTQLGDEPRVPATPEASADPTPVAQPMEPIGDVPMVASLSLEEVTWGTRLGLTCTYDPDSVEGDLPDETDYTLFVRTRTGEVEQVGSWRSVGGLQMEIMAATAVTASDLASVEVRTPGGRVVLRLTT